jgi:hypothetical protein
VQQTVALAATATNPVSFRRGRSDVEVFALPPDSAGNNLPEDLHHLALILL